MWLILALASSIFAALTSILAKIGIDGVNSNLATAIRTVVVLVMSWGMVFLTNTQSGILEISKKSWIFLILSGLATGASWLCYYKAIQLGTVSKVVPIDKSSTILTVLLAIICFGETDNLAVKLIGTTLLAVGIFLMIEKKQSEAHGENKSWMIYAVLSAVFAALTSILAKVGISVAGKTAVQMKKSDYAKYDLNRDGKIDSKDVAYVLVSWNK